MATTSRSVLHRPRTLTAIGLGCAVLWFAIATIFRAEEGTGADVAWLASTVVAAVGFVAFVLAGAAAMRARR